MTICERYIEKRFATSTDYYKNEWRRRFRSGTEWAYSDLRGRALLHKFAPTVYPSDVNEDFTREALV